MDDSIFRMRRVLLLLAALAICPLVSARIGETESECAARYGTPKTTREIVPGCPTNAYDYQGFLIRIAFAGKYGPAIKMIFEKRPAQSFKDDEVAAILTANTKEGTTWRGTLVENELVKKSDPITRAGAAFFTTAMGQKAWVRSDGVTAELMITKLGLTMTTPEAVAREKLAKEEAEAKRKAAIPAF